jgi:hypothetical protein
MSVIGNIDLRLDLPGVLIVAVADVRIEERLTVNLPRWWTRSVVQVALLLADSKGSCVRPGGVCVSARFVRT